MKTISFFSYKGGSGRSLLAYNTIPLLAKRLNATRQNPLIIIDMDIDSAGLTFLFEDRSNKSAFFTQDILRVDGYYPGQYEDTCDVTEHTFFKSLVGIGDLYGLDERSILFLPARTRNEINVEQIPSSYNANTTTFCDIKNLCSNSNCSGLIFDCPTGSQMTAQISLQLSQQIVVVMRITNQFRKGTYSFLKRIDSDHIGKKMIIVPNAVPHDEICLESTPYNYEAVKNEIRNEISDSVNNNELNFTMIDDGDFGVPEVTRFKFREDILYNRTNLSDDEQLALTMYKKFANIFSE